jgi:hypothetical protein
MRDDAGCGASLILVALALVAMVAAAYLLAMFGVRM